MNFYMGKELSFQTLTLSNKSLLLELSKKFTNADIQSFNTTITRSRVLGLIFKKNLKLNLSQA